MTVQQLIHLLETLPPMAPVIMQIQEPYDDDPQTLYQHVNAACVDEGEVILS